MFSASMLWYSVANQKRNQPMSEFYKRIRNFAFTLKNHSGDSANEVIIFYLLIIRLNTTNAK